MGERCPAVGCQRAEQRVGRRQVTSLGQRTGIIADDVGAPRLKLSRRADDRAIGAIDWIGDDAVGERDRCCIGEVKIGAVERLIVSQGYMRERNRTVGEVDAACVCIGAVATDGHVDEALHICAAAPQPARQGGGAISDDGTVLHGQVAGF